MIFLFININKKITRKSLCFSSFESLLDVGLRPGSGSGHQSWPYPKKANLEN